MRSSTASPQPRNSSVEGSSGAAFFDVARDAKRPPGQVRSNTALLEAARSSLPVGRLPQLDLVALGIDHPAELPILGFVDLLLDVHTFRTQGGEQRVQVGDAVVDHERGGEVLGVGGKQAPGRGPATFRIVRALPVERGPAPRLDVDSQVRLVPGTQSLRVFRLEEDATDTCDPLHGFSSARACAAFLPGNGRRYGAPPRASMRRAFADRRVGRGRVQGWPGGTRDWRAWSRARGRCCGSEAGVKTHEVPASVAPAQAVVSRDPPPTGWLHGKRTTAEERTSCALLPRFASQSHCWPCPP